MAVPRERQSKRSVRFKPSVLTLGFCTSRTGCLHSGSASNRKLREGSAEA
jgi:hypothetical protein